MPHLGHPVLGFVATGTAVVVTPISKVVYGDKVLKVGGSDTLEGSVGPVTKGLYDRVRQIQYGEVEDKFGWIFQVNKIPPLH